MWALSRTGAVSATAATVLCTAAVAVVAWKTRRRRPPNDQDGDTAYESLIGHTPLIRLSRLSQLIGRDIWVKCENLNPGGTGKDRAALGMLQDAEARGRLPPPISVATHSTSSTSQSGNATFISACAAGLNNDSPPTLTNLIVDAMQRSRSGGLVIEGTSGSTGIALATLCAARGHACLVVMPDDQATEKLVLLKALGATVHVVSTAAISNPNHYLQVAQRLADMAQRLFGIAAVCLNQFDNEANFQTHLTTTGPELCTQFQQQTCAGHGLKLQTQKPLHAFVMSAGTGGTIAGIGTYLKQQQYSCRVVLVDPPGSSLYHKIQHGVAYCPQQREQSLQRHRYDTLAEGIGLDRVTHNLQCGLSAIDEAIQVSDQEAVDMAHWLLMTEGLWVGSSSAMNVVGAIRVALELPPKANVVTIICDHGARYGTRFWNREFCLDWGLTWPRDDEVPRIPECLQSVLGSSTSVL